MRFMLAFKKKTIHAEINEEENLKREKHFNVGTRTGCYEGSNFYNSWIRLSNEKYEFKLKN